MTKVQSHVMLVLYNVRIVPLNMRKKNKETTECDKRTVICNFCSPQCEDSTIKCKKNKGTSECDKSSITSNVNTMQYENNIIRCEKKKIKNPPNVTKVQSYVTLVLRNARMTPSNMRNKGTMECEKTTVTCDVEPAQYADRTIKCEKKKREPPNVTKVQSYVIIVLRNARMTPSNVRKNKGTMECEKSTVTCDVELAQYADGTIKCEKK